MAGRDAARPRQGEPANWTARILAPLALVIVAATVVLLIGGSFDSGGDRERDRDRGGQTASAGCQPDAEQAVEDGYYVIEPGEDLSVVADRTCIEIERLINLNENLDPQLIQVGSCVDLVTDGCKALAEG